MKLKYSLALFAALLSGPPSHAQISSNAVFSQIGPLNQVLASRCTLGQLGYANDVPVGLNIYACTASSSQNPGTWSLQGGGVAGPGINIFGGVVGLGDAGLYYSTAGGTLGPYLSLGCGSLLEPSLFFTCKTTAATHTTEPLIFSYYNAPFDGAHAGFGIQGIASNSGSGTASGYTGHLIGVFGSGIDTATGGITIVGGELRADARSTASSPAWHYSGAVLTDVWNGAGTNHQTLKGAEVVLQSCLSSATTFVSGGPNNDLPGGYLQCTSPTASGTLIGLHVPPIQGGATKYAFYADADPVYFGGGVSLSNCSSSASPAVCAAANSGSVVIAASATSVVVDTTAITANSQVLVARDDSLGTKLGGITCDTQSSLVLGSPRVTARTGAASFTISVDVGPTTNPLCLSYLIVN